MNATRREDNNHSWEMFRVEGDHRLFYCFKHRDQPEDFEELIHKICGSGLATQVQKRGSLFEYVCEMDIAGHRVVVELDSVGLLFSCVPTDDGGALDEVAASIQKALSP